jgi:hypothetical protein
MKLLAFGGIALLALGIATLLTVEKRVAPGCSDTAVLDIVKNSVIDSPEAQRMSIVLDKISDETGALQDKRWHCAARLRTSKGNFPVQYTVGLHGPMNFTVNVNASFSEANRP